MKSPYDDDEFRRWADDKRRRLIPKMRGSDNVLLLAPNLSAKFDIEFALQIGAAILLEKPLVLVVQSGRTVLPKLRAIADKIIEMDLDDSNDPAVQERIRQALTELGKQ